MIRIDAPHLRQLSDFGYGVALLNHRYKVLCWHEEHPTSRQTAHDSTINWLETLPDEFEEQSISDDELLLTEDCGLPDEDAWCLIEIEDSKELECSRQINQVVPRRCYWKSRGVTSGLVWV